MTDLAIRKATRQGVKPLIGMYGKSGSGKTYSALLLARGIVGPSGRVILVDSESGRGRIFADMIPGGYDVIDLDPPFSPARYQQAIELAEANADITVVDSLSHEWSGESGVLDMQEAELDRMAGEDWKKREQCKMAAWIKPKMEHKRFIQRLLWLKCGLICCLRGEEKTHIAKGQDGKSKVITDEFSTPLFDPRFIFELLVNFETVAIDGKGGYVIPRKITHPHIAPLLPKANEQLTIKHGGAIAQWCAAPGGQSTDVKAVNALKAELWSLTAEKHVGKKAALLQWLIDEALISDTETLEDYATADRLTALIAKAKAKL